MVNVSLLRLRCARTAVRIVVEIVEFVFFLFGLRLWCEGHVQPGGIVLNIFVLEADKTATHHEIISGRVDETVVAGAHRPVADVSQGDLLVVRQVHG